MSFWLVFETKMVADFEGDRRLEQHFVEVWLSGGFGLEWCGSEDRELQQPGCMTPNERKCGIH